VTIIGYTDLASRLAKQSSTLYSNNLLRLTEELCKTKDGVINVNMDDDAIRGLTVIKDGAVTWPRAAAQAAGRPRPSRRGAAPRRRQEGPRPRRRRADVGKSLAIGVRRRRAAVLAGGRCTRRPASCRTSRCSCWPASSATWWCGTSRRRCTRR
jgi:hypothetical protein